MTPKWTLGMAVYDTAPNFVESIRATFAAMSALVHHPLVREVVVVDNSPHKDNPLRDHKNLKGELVPGLLSKMGGKGRYVEMPTPQGTSPSRNRIFEVATSEFVVVMDPHVLLYPGTFEALDEAVSAHPQDLFHGPMMTENGGVLGTHMNAQWRAEMLGTWGVAYVAPDGKTPFSVITIDDRTLTYVTLPGDTSEQKNMSREEAKALGLPETLWPGHEQRLASVGCKVAMEVDPFPVPGHGMGFFACRRDAWIPFHPDAVGFGGEEVTTGWRYRQAGRRCWCVPKAKWWHHFHRQGDQVPYPLLRWDKIRNYALEYRRQGRDLAELRLAFPSSICPQGEWDQIVAGASWPKPHPTVTPGTQAASREEAHARSDGVPVQHKPVAKPARQGCAKTGETGNQVASKGLEQLYQGVRRQDSPIRADVYRLRMLATDCRHPSGWPTTTPDSNGNGQPDVPGDVVEVSHLGISYVPLMAAGPRTLTSFGDGDVSGRQTGMDRLHPEGSRCVAVGGGEPAVIPDCDFLFLDVDPHTGDHYHELLTRYHKNVRRYVAIHDTLSYGEEWNGLPGLRYGIARFLTENPEWSVVAEFAEQNGLTVLSRFAEGGISTWPEEKDPPPPTVASAPPPPKEGPGTELKAILASLGIDPSKDCGCNSRALQMDLYGPDGCEEHFNEIVGWLRDGQVKWGWAAKVKAATMAVTTGLAFKLNLTNPFPGLVREAVRRAREKKR